MCRTLLELPVADVNTPKTLLLGMAQMKEKLDNLRKPIKGRRLTLRPGMSAAEEVEVETNPLVHVTLDMPEAGHVRLYAHSLRPTKTTMVLAEFSGDDYNALKSQVEGAGVSWEEFFSRQVINAR